MVPARRASGLLPLCGPCGVDCADAVALGAKDGQLLCGRAIDNDAPLSRRDQGLEFLDVTGQIRVERVAGARSGHSAEEVYDLTNTSGSVVDTHLLIIVHGLPGDVRLNNASGTTRTGDPYIRVFLPGGVLQPGQKISRRIAFSCSSRSPVPAYTVTLLSGQGNP
jgi:hypothetical protein